MRGRADKPMRFRLVVQAMQAERSVAEDPASPKRDAGYDYCLQAPATCIGGRTPDMDLHERRH